MGKIGVIIKFELVKIVRDMWYPIFYFLFPFLCLILSLNVLGIEKRDFNESAKDWIKNQIGLKDYLTIGVVDHSGLTSLYGNYSYRGSSQQGINQVTKFKNFFSEEEGYKALRNREVEVCFFIPKDFISTREIKSYFLLEKGSLPQLFPPNSFKEWFEDNLLRNVGLRPELLEQIKAPFSSTQNYIDLASGEVIEWRTLGFFFKKSFLTVFIVLFVTFIILTPSDYLFDSVRDEKKTRLLEIMLTSATLTEFLLGKFLSSLVATIVPVLFWLGVGRFFLQKTPSRFLFTDDLGPYFTDERLGLIAFYGILGTIFYGAFFLAIGLIGNPTISRRIATLCRLIMFVPLFLILKPLVFRTEISLPFKILSYLPIFTPTAMTLRIGIDEPPTLIEAIVTALLSLSAAGGLLKLATILLRKSIVAEALFPLDWKIRTG
jgi:hypothetical protein